MKALAIVLCMLLVIAPAGAQQIADRSAPNFYVPYAVSGSRAAAIETESSSEDALLAIPVSLPSAPPPQRYPIRRPYRRFGPPRYIGYPPPPGPPISTRAALIIAGVVAGIIVTGVVKADW